ncbi:lytic transglycosylase domain-containing protein [Bradyrhizobium elkanii]|uniref:lytic transglycosylase domain-containing protein n=1 Tax=Bradyrhizobium elkanii TaxID=29448 RepID=UPI001FD9E51B|nr:lytic transglycosylase domain-containing protein [Bradyrhizobium elkanii]MBP2434120.1 hypothetical protein [Bradyrhizobium elkanii]WLA88960.1 lytic transglycosylase domain-containing protein [Bradyrhizobium elkanii]
MIVRALSFRPAIPLFGAVLHHSSVPTNDCAAVARSGGPGRPNGRREAALPWTGASTVAGLRLFEGSLRAVMPLFVALSVSNVPAVADARFARYEANYRAVDSHADFVEQAALRFGVPLHWIRAVINVESAGDVRARSPKGAMGLMQIMPEAWAELRLRYDLGNDPYDPHDNILAGTAYLRELFDRYGSPGFLAAYNADLLATRSISPAVHCLLRPKPICRGLHLSSAAISQLPAQSGVCAHQQRRSSLFGLKVQRPLRGWSLSARQTGLRRRPPFTTSRPSCHRQQGCSS